MDGSVRLSDYYFGPGCKEEARGGLGLGGEGRGGWWGGGLIDHDLHTTP